VLEEALAEHADHLGELADWGGVAPEVLASVAGLAVQPSLQAVATALKPLLQTIEGWEHGYCPACGAWAGLAELQLAEQQRHLRCLRCGTDWASPRLRCPYCGNRDHDSLGYLQGEREPRFRVEVCERCKGYLKAADAFESNPPAGLALDDLASIHLDLAAIERGYSRPAQPGFRIELGEPEPDEALEDLLESD
jgi:FdhE protein